MDIDKSLYMKDFLKLRSTLGCVFNREARSVLHTNLYDEFLPRKVKTEVEEVVEEIQEKTIQILDKGQLEAKENTKQEQDKTEDTLVLFEDAVDKPVEEDVSDDVGDDDVGDDDVGDDVGAEEDDKSTKETLLVPNVDLLGGGKQLKKIVINPNYVAVDS